MATSTLIIPATLADMDAITRIYNDEVVDGVATFDTTPKTRAQQEQWFQAHDIQHPILVARAGGEVIGWGSLSRYSDREAYDGLAEDSLYIDRTWRGRGVGRLLLGELLEAGRKAGLHSVLARITAGNDSSIHLHKAFGFEVMGVLREAGVKFGRLLDVVFMQKLYEKKPNSQ